jgi:hypothetical protein
MGFMNHYFHHIRIFLVLTKIVINDELRSHECFCVIKRARHTHCCLQESSFLIWVFTEACNFCCAQELLLGTFPFYSNIITVIPRNHQSNFYNNQIGI